MRNIIERISSQRRLRFLVLTVLVIAYCIFIYLQLRGIIQVPKEVQLGLITVRLYGICILIATLTAFFIAVRIAKKYLDLGKIDVNQALLWFVIPGLIGARLWHVATDWYLYQDNLVGIIQIWNGGLGIYGGLLGGFLGAFIWARRNKINFLMLLEIVVIGIPLAQAIGRLGNMFNQELYGPRADLPWGMYIATEKAFFHPNFLYEQLANLVLFGLLVWLYKRRGIKADGLLVVVYTIGYGVIRFCVDLLRFEPRIFLGLTTAQLTSIVFPLVISSIYLLFKFRKSGMHA